MSGKMKGASAFAVAGAAILSVLVPGHALRAQELLLSTEETATLGGLTFENGDLVRYEADGDTAVIVTSERKFEANENLDAVHRLPGGGLIMSTSSDAVMGGVAFRDGDLVRYDQLQGTVSLFFSEDLFAEDEDIDAVHVLPGGTIVLSTTSQATLGGLTFEDGDLVEYDRDADVATLLFSGTAFGGEEDIDGVAVLHDGHILLSTTSSAILGGLEFGDADVVEYDPVGDVATILLDSSRFTSDPKLDLDVDAIGVYYVPSKACPADIDVDAAVTRFDLLAVVDAWGLPGGPADVNGDGVVDVDDLVDVVLDWGPCG